MKKGIDGTFVQYGIKKEDMQLIEAACMAEGIDSEWVKEYILRLSMKKRATVRVSSWMKRTLPKC